MILHDKWTSSNNNNWDAIISWSDSNYIPLGGTFFSGTFAGTFLSCDSLVKPWK